MLRDHTLDQNGNESQMFWDAASRDEKRDQPIPTPLQPIAGTHSRTCTFPAPGVNAIPNIELSMKVRPIGMDVLEALVASGHLSPDVLAKVPTFTTWKRRVHYQPDSNRSLLDEPDPPGDCTKYKCMLDAEGCCTDAADSGNAAMP